MSVRDWLKNNPVAARVLAAAKPRPVWLVEGRERSSGAPMSFVYQGLDDMRVYLSRRAFAEPPKETRLGKATLKAAPALAARQAPGADFLFLSVPRHCESMAPEGTTAMIPSWVRMVTALDGPQPAASSKYARSGKAAAKGRFTARVTRERRELDDFMERMHLPYIRSRHGDTANAPNLDEARRGFADGKWDLILVERDGRPLAGVTLDYTKSPASFRHMGVLDASEELLAERISDTCYYFMLSHARKRGEPRLDLGMCRPLVSDGIVEYKRLYGGFVSDGPRSMKNHFALAPRAAGPGYRAFLAANPPVSRGKTGLELLCFDASKADDLRRRYCAEGTLSLRVADR